MDPTQLIGGPEVVIPRLVPATLVGAALGRNRDLRHRPAGLRLHALVSPGTAAPYRR